MATYRILSIDGGGIRGIIPGRILAHMVKITNTPLHQLFDAMAGTSTGGILSLSSCAPKIAGSKENRFSIEEACSIYTDPMISGKNFSQFMQKNVEDLGSRGKINLISVTLGGRTTFTSDIPGFQKLVGTQYSAHQLEVILRERFSSLTLKDMLTDVLITSLDINTREPKLFTRAQARRNPQENHLVWEIARVTSAAPTFFDPHTLRGMPLVDGGMVANNPTLCMLLDAKERGIRFKDMFCVSLGTGAYNPPLDTYGYGQLRFAPWVYPVMSTASSALVEKQVKAILKNRYHRFQADLGRDIPLDESSNIDSLKEIGDKLIKRESKRIEEVCNKLMQIGKKG